MGYNRCMRTRVHCACGWQRSLSPYYAGKQLRCPQCDRVVTAEGADQGGAYRYARGGPVAPPVRVVYVPIARATGIWRILGAMVLIIVLSLALAFFAVWQAGVLGTRQALPETIPHELPSAAPVPDPEAPRQPPKAVPERDLEREDEF